MSDHEIWVSALRDTEGEPGADLQIACSCDVILLTEYDDGRGGSSLTLEAVRSAVERHLADAGEEVNEMAKGSDNPAKGSPREGENADKILGRGSNPKNK